MSNTRNTRSTRSTRSTRLTRPQRPQGPSSPGRVTSSVDRERPSTELRASAPRSGAAGDRPRAAVSPAPVLC